MKTFILASAVIMCATTALAQSMPNYGPNPPPGADSFGQPPTGYLPPGVSRYGPPRAYAPPPNYRTPGTVTTSACTTSRRGARTT